MLDRLSSAPLPENLAAALEAASDLLEFLARLDYPPPNASTVPDCDVVPYSGICIMFARQFVDLLVRLPSLQAAIEDVSHEITEANRSPFTHPTIPGELPMACGNAHQFLVAEFDSLFDQISNNVSGFDAANDEHRTDQLVTLVAEEWPAIHRSWVSIPPPDWRDLQVRLLVEASVTAEARRRAPTPPQISGPRRTRSPAPPPTQAAFFTLAEDFVSSLHGSKQRCLLRAVNGKGNVPIAEVLRALYGSNDKMEALLKAKDRLNAILAAKTKGCEVRQEGETLILSRL